MWGSLAPCCSLGLFVAFALPSPLSKFCVDSPSLPGNIFVYICIFQIPLRSYQEDVVEPPPPNLSDEELRRHRIAQLNRMIIYKLDRGALFPCFFSHFIYFLS